MWKIPIIFVYTSFNISVNVGGFHSDLRLNIYILKVTGPVKRRALESVTKITLGGASLTSLCHASGDTDRTTHFLRYNYVAPKIRDLKNVSTFCRRENAYGILLIRPPLSTFLYSLSFLFLHPRNQPSASDKNEQEILEGKSFRKQSVRLSSTVFIASTMLLRRVSYVAKWLCNRAGCILYRLAASTIRFWPLVLCGTLCTPRLLSLCSFFCVC